MNKEHLKLKVPKYKDEVELFIEGDENDGDYVSKTNTVSLKEFEDLLPALKKLKKNGDWENHNLTEEECELISEIKPYGNSDNDIHTITRISCWFLSKDDNVRYEIKL